jgi:hypothetical protein
MMRSNTTTPKVQQIMKRCTPFYKLKRAKAMTDQKLKTDLLIILSEECIEVSTCVHKYLRFGEDSTYLKCNPTELEVGQVLGMLELLQRYTILNPDIIAEHKAKQIAKIETLLQLK